MIHLNTHLSKKWNEDVNENEDRWFIWTHTYQREMKM